MRRNKKARKCKKTQNYKAVLKTKFSLYAIKVQFYLSQLKLIIEQNVTDKIVRFAKRIKHVCEYLPLLWKDQHWDYHYLFSIIDFKLKKMEETIIKNDLIENVQGVTKSIRVFRKLLKRANDEEWHTELRKNILERTWGKSIWWKPCKNINDEEVFKTDRPGLRRFYLLNAPYDVLMGDMYSAYRQEVFSCYERQNQKQQEDLEKALLIFKTHYHSWWD